MKHVIIGNSAAGIACVEAIRSRDAKSEITVISEEDYHIYSRCLLSYLLSGEIKEEKMVYRPDGFYKEHRVEPLLGSRCEKISPERGTVTVKGKEIKFDRLLLATGARPKFPDIKGIDKDGVFGLRTINDAKNILKLLKSARTVAILGGGLIGLKAAYGLSTHNKDIRVVVKSGQVLSQILDKRGGAIFQDWIGKKGVKVMTGLEAKEITGKGRVEGVVLDNGQTLDCQMVIVGKGVQPNTELAKEAGLKIAEGILVDDFLKTGAAAVYAAGDAAQAKGILSGAPEMNAVWPAAVEQGRAAGLNMAGGKTAYDGSMAMNSVEFFGLPVISMGVTRSGEGLEELIYENTGKNIYKKVLLKGGSIAGMVFVNDIKSAGVIGGLMRKNIDVSSIRDSLLDEGFGFARIAALVKDNADKFDSEEFKDIALTY